MVKHLDLLHLPPPAAAEVLQLVCSGGILLDSSEIVLKERKKSGR